MKAIIGKLQNIESEYEKNLASWKKNGCDTLSGEANSLYGG